MSIAAIVLAAGDSRRMGRPKMLLPWGATSVLGQVVGVFTQAGVDEILVVTGGAGQAVSAEVAHLAETWPVRVVANPAYQAGGMLSSLQRGLAELGPDVEAALIGLGDQPQVRLENVNQLLDAYRTKPGACIVVPSHRQHRGHPWLVARSCWAGLLGLHPPQTPREFLQAHATEIHYVEADESILQDLDTPEVYERFRPKES